MSWRLRTLRGNEAFAHLDDAGFVRDWQALTARDTKHHWFQQPFFCSTWYSAYRASHAPLLLLAEDGSGLRGVMPLAQRDDEVVHAGAHQCEYQGWIADPDIDASFARAAVAAVLRGGSIGRWEWRYVAPGVSEEWLNDPGCAHLSEAFASPLLDVADEAFVAERWRGRLRSHHNRLRRRGLSYRRVEDAAEARTLLHRLARWCDLRQAAAHATLPFADDAAKLPLHERLLQDPGQVWLSGLFLDETPIAAHMGFLHGGELAVGIQGYDPGESRSSPGALLLLEIAADLATSGARTLDLTPGGDAWKERFASHHRPVHRMVLHRSRAAALAEQAQRGLRANARRALTGVGADRLLRGVETRPLPAARVDVIATAELPPPTATMSSLADDIEATLLHQAIELGADRAAEWLPEAIRRLGAGWRAAVGNDDRGGRVLLWAAPANTGVDLTDAANPIASTQPRDPDILTVRADAAGSIPPTTAVAEALAAALACWGETPRDIWLLTDAGAAQVRAWLGDSPARWQRAG